MTAPTHPPAAMIPPSETAQTPAPDEAAATDPGPPSDPELVADPAAVAGRVPAIESGTAATSATAKPWLAGALVGALIAALTLVGGALAGLLVHEFSSIDDRLAAVDARLDSLEAGQAEIARTLAVLVAELNARAHVDAALAGRLRAPDTAVPYESRSAEP